MEKKYKEEKEVFTTFFKARSRKYYFDIREKTNGDRYVTISELQPGKGSFKKMRILVFEEYIKEFASKLNEVVSELGDIPEKKDREERKPYEGKFNQGKQS